MHPFQAEALRCVMFPPFFSLREGLLLQLMSQNDNDILIELNFLQRRYSTRVKPLLFQVSKMLRFEENLMGS